ncbi:MAG: CinA family protein [Chloroflexota bacterium]
MEDLSREIGELLRSNGLTLGTVESATGGLIAYLITAVPGSSDYFKGSITAYSNETKARLVGVKEESLTKYGAVSRFVAEEMASGGRKVLNVDICLSDTGIAGPGGTTPEKPVGLFYVGLADKNGSNSREYHFSGNREEVRRQAAGAVLDWLKQHLLGLG